MSFFLLCCQFARNQMLNLRSKPYTGFDEDTDRERVYWDRLRERFLGTMLAKVFLFLPFPSFFFRLREGGRRGGRGMRHKL